jgi:hypothetical protein
MRKWIIAFGILDLLKIEKVLTLIQKLYSGEIVIHFLNIFGILFCSIVVLTGILLIRLKKIGFIFSYIEFPFRLMFAYFSFSFLLYINRFSQTENILAITILLAILEIIRLIITINIHWKIFKRQE